MKKHFGLFARIMVVLLATVFVVTGILHVVLSPAVATKLVNRYAPGFVDGELSFGKASVSMFRHFPYPTLMLEDAVLAYPHGRFEAEEAASPDAMLMRLGRGEIMDTLACMGSLEASLDVLPLISGRIHVPFVSLFSPRVFAKYFNEGKFNWNMLGMSTEDDDGTSGMPKVKLGRIRVGGRPRIVFCSPRDTLFATLSFRDMALGGTLKLDDPFAASTSFNLDSLKVAGRLASDTLLFALDRLQVEKKHRKVGVSAEAAAFIASSGIGRVRLPLSLDAYLRFPEDSLLSVEVDRLEASVAHIPVEASGLFRYDGGAVFADAKAGIRECMLQDLVGEYGKIAGLAPDAVSTDARLEAFADVRGWYDGEAGLLPEIAAKLHVPECNVRIKDIDDRMTAALELSATTRENALDFSLDRLFFDSEALKLDFRGAVEDLLGSDPLILPEGRAEADLGKLLGWLPAGEYGSYRAEGDMTLEVAGSSRLSCLTLAGIGNSSLRASLKADNINAATPGDTLAAMATGLAASITPEDEKDDKSDQKLALVLSADSLSAAMAGELFLRASKISGKLRTSNMKVELADTGFTPFTGSLSEGRLLVGTVDSSLVALINASQSFRLYPKSGNPKIPVLTVSGNNPRAFLRASAGRVMVRDFKFDLSAALNTFERNQRIKAFRDSVEKAHPDVPKDSIFSVLRRERPSWAKADDFTDHDFDFKLGETFARYYRDWDIKGDLKAGSAFLVTPYFPLRTSLTGLDATFDNDAFRLGTVEIKSGQSELSVNGRLAGLRRTLLFNAPVDARLAVKGKYLNFNELLNAYALGSGYIGETADVSLADNDYERLALSDTISTDAPSEDVLLVIPRNMNASIALRADSLDYSTLSVSSARAAITMRERCLQLSDAKAVSNAGSMAVNAFYSTKSVDEIKTGLDLKLTDVAADKVLALVPSLDTIMPILKGFSGNINCMAALTVDLDTLMNVKIPSLSGAIRIEGDNLKIKDNEDYRDIAKTLMFRHRKEGHVDHLMTEAVLSDGHIEIFPFIANVDRYKIAFSGIQELDMSFRYHVSVLKSPLLFRFGIDIKGDDFDNWNFKLGKAKYRSSTLPVFSEVIDDMQINLSKSIKDIFKKGVETAVRENRQMQALASKKAEEGYVRAVDQPLEELSDKLVKMIEKNASELEEGEDAELPEEPELREGDDADDPDDIPEEEPSEQDGGAGIANE
ncbi:MAG: hypothetical protein HUJ94_01575 [Bacteroidales bacterium]|nr:hypothetical protein [Bacteroidales bacterium]